MLPSSVSSSTFTVFLSMNYLLFCFPFVLMYLMITYSNMLHLALKCVCVDSKSGMQDAHLVAIMEADNFLTMLHDLSAMGAAMRRVMTASLTNPQVRYSLQCFVVVEGIKRKRFIWPNHIIYFILSIILEFQQMNVASLVKILLKIFTKLIWHLQ